MIKIGSLLKSYLIGIVAIGISVNLYAAGTAKVQATVDRNEMGLGDTLIVTVSVMSQDEVEAQPPRVPNFDGFQLIQTNSSSSQSHKLVQGPRGMEFQSQRTLDFIYMLAATKIGRMTIPAFEVVVDGKVQTTKPIVITVDKNGSGSGTRQGGRPSARPGRPGGFDEDDPFAEAEAMFNQLLQRRAQPGKPTIRNLPPANANLAFFVQLELDKKEVYAGEQITANWYIYTRGNILSLDRSKFPDLKGFWKEIIEEVPALTFQEEEIVNGVPFRRALLASHALFPISAGTSVVDEFKIKASVQLPTNGFGLQGFGKAYSYERSSDRVSINVKPLPLEGRPNDFSGGVGQYKISAQVETGRKLVTNQPFTLRVRFEGRGNAKAIELPPIEWPKSFELYNTKSDSKFAKDGSSYKEFEILLIPRVAGQNKIPPLKFSFFDPQLKKYVTESSPEIDLMIEQGDAVAKTEDLQKDPVAQASSPPKVEPVLPGVVSSFSNTVSISHGVWLIAFGLVSLILGFKARSELLWGMTRKTIKSEIDARFKKLKKIDLNQNYRGYTAELSNILVTILGKLGGTEVSGQDLEKTLEVLPASVRRELGENLRKIFQELQFLSFAPESAIGDKKSSENIKRLQDETKKILEKTMTLVDKA